MRASDSSSISVGALTDDDDFDRWVSGRIDNVQAATNAAQQYVNSGAYSSGLPVFTPTVRSIPAPAIGNCWRPYGVGLGWSPFDSGFWFSDPSIGMSFIGNQPWGWLPYHYGGWICDPLYGWMWAPSGFGNGLYGGVPRWSPVTGTWLHSRTGPIGIVPVHPLDVHGKTPINLAQGVFPVSAGAVSRQSPGGRRRPMESGQECSPHTLSIPTSPPPPRQSAFHAPWLAVLSVRTWSRSIAILPSPTMPSNTAS